VTTKADLGTPNIIAVLVWWQERPDWLAACVASCAPFCTHIVAVDGAYSLFPNATSRSPGEQVAAIKDTAAAHGMGCSVHQPEAPWDGQEPEKRSFAFKLAESVAVPHRDWYFSIDADEEAELQAEPERLIRHLATTTLNVGTVHFDYEGEQAMRRMFRALPGLRAVTNHEFAADDGHYFSGDPAQFGDDEWLPIKINHSRHYERTAEQAVDKYVGYQLAMHYGFTGPLIARRG